MEINSRLTALKNKLRQSWEILKINIAHIAVKSNEVFFKYFKKYDYLFFIIIVSILAVFARISFFAYKSGDYNSFLKPWFDSFVRNGGFKHLGTKIGDYTPFYRTFLCIASYFPINSLTQIKIFSITFDFVGAIGMMFILFHISKNKLLAVFGYTFTLFLPSVILNSAIWGQCDMIYSSFVIWSIYFILTKKERTSFIFFGIAFCIKLQSIFFLPVLVILWLKQKVKLRNFLYIPLVYFISCLPVLFAGGSLEDVLGVYFLQAGQYPYLSLSAPSFFSFFSNDLTKTFDPASTIAGIAVIGSAAFIVYKLDINLEKKENFIIIAYFFALLAPFVLPYMHERYFFLSEVLAILVILLAPKKYKVAAITSQLALFFNIINYFFGDPLFSGSTLTFNITRIMALVNLISLSMMCLNYKLLLNDKEELLTLAK